MKVMKKWKALPDACAIVTLGDITWMLFPWILEKRRYPLAVKPVAINRKNSLFSDSVEGAVASAIIFSIINTAVANHLDAYKYLEYIFRQLPNLNFIQDNSILDAYLPWSEKVQDECRMQNDGPETTDKDDLIYETA
jgi:hypothetical protein